MERGTKKVYICNVLVLTVYINYVLFFKYLFCLRNFPTAQNVARRQAEQKEKLDRGEVLYEPKTRFGTTFIIIINQILNS